MYSRMLKQMLTQIEAILSHHNKVLLVRFDLNKSDYDENSQDISLFFRQFLDTIKKTYKLKRVAYSWAREQGKTENRHYHCFIALDGNKVQTSYRIVEQIKWYWEIIHDGSVHFTQPKCFHMLHRNKPESFKDPIYHISYLAKGRGKGYKPQQAKNYSCSRLKPK